MKHGIKLRKLSRTSSHRMALLRNLVSALLHHEQIKTTVPKAKEAARVVERMITLGKRGTNAARSGAQAYLFPAHVWGEPSRPQKLPAISPEDYELASRAASSSVSNARPSSSRARSRNDDDASSEDDSIDLTSDASASAYNLSNPTTLLPKLFDRLATRYADRPGGYTRILRFGNRPGDNAPVCILSLVDGPRDLRAEITARTLGRQAYEWGLERGETSRAIDDIVSLARAGEAATPSDERWRQVNENTRRSLQKLVKFKSVQEVEAFAEKAKRYAVSHSTWRLVSIMLMVFASQDMLLAAPMTPQKAQQYTNNRPER